MKLTEAQLRTTIAAYNAAEGNQSHTAAALGITRETLQHRLRRCRDELGADAVKDWPKATGGVSSLAQPELLATVAAYNAAAGDTSAAAMSLGIGIRSLQERLRRIRVDFPAGSLGEFKTVAAERTLEEDEALHRARERDRYSAGRYKDAMRELASARDELQKLQWASRAGFEPASWTVADRALSKSEHIPYLHTSDFQCGEVIRADETEAGYGYDSEIFRRRYRLMIETTIRLCFDHAGGSWTYPGIIYTRGGDAISGGIHEELRDTDDMTPIEAVQCVFEEEAAGIRHLAEAFGKVDVKSPDAAGNHDRTTMKPRSKNAAGHSFDMLVSFMLQREFAKDKRVTFQTSRSFDVVYPIYNKTILLTHGDRIGSGGGQGFIGPAATILRGAQKVIQEQAALGRVIDRVDMGHFHTFIYYVWVLCNGSVPGYSEYAKSFRMRPQDPIQTLLFHHPKHGVVDVRPINLRDA